MDTFERGAIYLLPAAVLIAGLAVVAVAPFAWGAGDHAGLDSWMPPFTALVFGLPAVLTGAFSLRSVARKARGSLSLESIQLLFVSLIWPVAIIVLLVLAARIPVQGTYDRFVEDSDIGRIGLNEQVRPFEVTAENVSPAFYMQLIVATAIAPGGYTAAAGYFYVNAISSTSSQGPDAWKGENDPVGEMLRGRRGPHAP